MKRAFIDDDNDGRQNPLSKTLGSPALNYEFSATNEWKGTRNLRFYSPVKTISGEKAPTTPKFEDSEESLSPGRKIP